MASQKGSGDTDLKWNARLASTWILDQLKQRKIVKGQAYGETLQVSGTWKKRDAGVSFSDIYRAYTKKLNWIIGRVQRRSHH